MTRQPKEHEALLGEGEIAYGTLIFTEPETLTLKQLAVFFDAFQQVVNCASAMSFAVDVAKDLEGMKDEVTQWILARLKDVEEQTDEVPILILTLEHQSPLKIGFKCLALHIGAIIVAGIIASTSVEVIRDKDGTIHGTLKGDRVEQAIDSWLGFLALAEHSRRRGRKNGGENEGDGEKKDDD